MVTDEMALRTTKVQFTLVALSLLTLPRLFSFRFAGGVLQRRYQKLIPIYGRRSNHDRDTARYVAM